MATKKKATKAAKATKKSSSSSWKNERASVHTKNAARPRSNKYSKSDTTHDRKPKSGERSRVWVGGYTRADGVAVAGHYRETTG